jgi:urea ABC transporter ATP-binding protein UrtE
MLSVTDLHSGYGRIPIVTGVSFEVAAGEFVGVLGHNGMGKTTLLKTLIGLIRPTGGRVALDGRDVTGLDPHARARRGVGYVPQGREIFPALTVHENLRMGVLAAGARDWSVVDEVLEEFPTLRPLLERYGGALSGGEQQLLALARCLCGRPRLVLLDEPTEGIQPSIIDAMTEKLDGLRRRLSLTVVLVEQNLDFIHALSQRVLIIHKGRITREVAPEHLRDADMVAEFVGLA